MSDPKPVELTEADALFNILFGHQRIPTYDGTAGQRCTGCDSLKGETDGPNSPRQATHLAALILEAGWVSPEAREAAARREALLEAAEELVPEDLRRHGANCDTEMERLRAKVARVEALAEKWARTAREALPHLGCLDMYSHCAGEVRAALAEPERDEESGR